MKTRIWIIVGIVVIAVSAGIFIQLNNLIHVESSAFDYKKTKPVIQDTYLDKTILQWQNESFNSLMAYHDIHHDSFFEELGSLLIKNEMVWQLEQENITNVNDGFDVYPGLMLTSLPPHVSFEAVINGTDGNSYRLQGGTFANTVSDVKISKLVFYDTAEKLPIDSIMSENPTVKILPNNGNGPQVEPFDLVINGDKHNMVYFENNLEVPIQILGGGDYHNPKWAGPIILPYGKGTMTFSNTGVFEWSARSLPLPGNEWREGYGNGEINVLSNETSNLPPSIKWNIAGAIIQNSEIPWNGMGARTDGLYIDFNRAVFDMLPDAKEYYTARVYQLVPFDVPIIIEGHDLGED